jgi:hypothetical protein
MQLDKYEADRIVGVTMGIKVIVNNQFKVAYVNARSFEKNTWQIFSLGRTKGVLLVGVERSNSTSEK